MKAGTGAGDVTVTVIDAGGEPQTIEIGSGSGRVELALPASFGGVVELETAYARQARATTITAPWELARETTDWSDREGTPRGRGRSAAARSATGAAASHPAARAAPRSRPVSAASAARQACATGRLRRRCGDTLTI